MTLDKGENGLVGKNFVQADFDCQCSYSSCIVTPIDEGLIAALDALWEIAGAFKINSGYRCVKHNKDVGGEKGSQHLLGKAADIESMRGLSGPELSRYVLQVDALERGGLGVADHWLHTDVRGVRARWTYPIVH